MCCTISGHMITQHALHISHLPALCCWQSSRTSDNKFELMKGWCSVLRISAQGTPTEVLTTTCMTCTWQKGCVQCGEGS